MKLNICYEKDKLVLKIKPGQKRKSKWYFYSGSINKGFFISNHPEIAIKSDSFEILDMIANEIKSGQLKEIYSMVYNL